MKNKKSLGQHWLKNRAILEEIAELAAKENKGKKESVCVEIGPGLGFLTSSLLRRFEKVIAVEFDEDLARKLPGSFPGKDLEVINEDILKYVFPETLEDFVVAGNIPYYITSPIVEKLLTLEKMPKRIVLLMQKEVAERIAGEKETVLSLFVKNRAKVQLGPVVLAEEFTPPPKVNSQVLVLEPLEGEFELPDEAFKLIKIGFSAPRKKLIHNLSSIKPKEKWIEIFEKNCIDINARPGDLKIEDWKKIYSTN